MSLKTWQERNIEDLACPKWVGYSYDPSSRVYCRLKCKGRLCPCSQYWSWRWRGLLGMKNDLEPNRCTRALTLTCASNPHYKRMHSALRYFWQLLRKAQKAKRIEYWGTVEFNQSHKLPHLHFILDTDSYIPYKILRFCWIKAQQWAKFPRVAWVCRIEKIKKGVQSYFTKYLTKLDNGGKDEIPRPENWQGRYVRYSRNFFPQRTSVMMQRLYLQAQLHGYENEDVLLKSGAIRRRRNPLTCRLYSLRPAALSYSLLTWNKTYKAHKAALNAAWEPDNDKERAVVLIPAVGQLLLDLRLPELYPAVTDRPVKIHTSHNDLTSCHNMCYNRNKRFVSIDHIQKIVHYFPTARFLC